MKNLIYTFFFILGLAFVIKADTWSLPTEEKYCSENKKYCLKVEPKKLESQLSYFQDKVDEKENAGADKNVKENYCKGTFFAKGKKLWKIQLDNEVSPVSALISNDGNYVITFDNWHGVGYGDNIVAIYNGLTGKLIKKLGLSDFLTESDIDNLPHSSSSIHWSGKHLIDYQKNQLVLKIAKGGYNSSEYFDVHIDLSNGTVLEEKIDRFPSLQLLIVDRETDDKSKINGEMNLDIIDCQIGKEVKQISSTELLKKVLYKEIPKYPPAAKAVRAMGKVVINVLISENGDVECAKVISGHPLLRASIEKAVKGWKFQKSESKYLGQIIFEGRDVLVSPDGKITDKLLVTVGKLFP